MSQETDSGLGVGAVIAGIISWVHWHSVGGVFFTSFLGGYMLYTGGKGCGFLCGA
jgi:hypothetical protein